MNKLEYSDLVKRKMIKLKKWLTEHYDLDMAKSILSEMMADADRLKEYEKSGNNIAETSNMMKNPSYCYKFYWLEAIVNLIAFTGRNYVNVALLFIIARLISLYGRKCYIFHVFQLDI